MLLDRLSFILMEAGSKISLPHNKDQGEALLTF